MQNFRSRTLSALASSDMPLSEHPLLGDAPGPSTGCSSSAERLGLLEAEAGVDAAYDADADAASEWALRGGETLRLRGGGVACGRLVTAWAAAAWRCCTRGDSAARGGYGGWAYCGRCAGWGWCGVMGEG